MPVSIIEKNLITDELMIITRKIQVFVCEDDKNLRKEYYEKLYNNRNVAVKVANMAVRHEFALDHKKTLGTRL